MVKLEVDIYKLIIGDSAEPRLIHEVKSKGCNIIAVKKGKDSIITGISSMFLGEASTDMMVYFVPIYSSVNMIIAVLTFEIVPLHFFITILSSVVYVTIFIFVLNKLFQSEKIMFSKQR